MKSWAQLCSHGARAVAGGVFSFVLWTLWLGLALLLALQVYVVVAEQLALPAFALRQLESRLAESGLRATFGRTSFDPTGRILMEDVRVSLPGFAEPIATVSAIYVHLNPLYLLVGRIEPSEVRLVRATAAVPPLLSPSGSSEEIIRNLDATLEFAGRELIVRQLTARVAGVKLTARGTVPLPRRQKSAGADPLAALISRHFATACRQALLAQAQIRQIDAPSLHIDIAPSESGALSLNLAAQARGLTLTAPVALQTGEISAQTRLLFFGDAPPTHVEIAAREVSVPGFATGRGVNATIYGRFRPGTTQFELREIAATADALSAAGAEARSVSALVVPRPLPRIDATVTARILGAPLAVRTEADLNERSAQVRFEGAISPDVLDLVSARVGVNVRKFYEFDSLTAERGEADFGPGWKFERLRAGVRIPRMNSYGVIMEDGRAEVELQPGRFFSPRAFARIGENFARGSYEHDLTTHDYRFLLDGRLRPIAISAWFREWWPNFFRPLEFVAGPPEASVDVSGSWREGRRSRVFVFADTGKSVIRGVPFDRVRTRLFIRPAFFDGLEMLAQQGRTDAHGRFTLIADPETNDWHTLELGLNSTLDLKVASQLLGPAGARSLAAFRLEAPPELKLRGTFSGPAAPKGTRDRLRIEARTAGEFRYHNFPLRDASFVATLEGDDVVLDDFEAMLADGVAGGHARIWQVDGQRRLGFDFTLQDATLGRLSAEVQSFFAAQKGQTAAPPGKFVTEKANVKLNFAASAEGLYSDPFSFRGDGKETMSGAEIGEVPLLGQLSELLKFTALRFAEARANFIIEGSKVAFPKVELRGANSTIDAHGDYALDKRTLDFNAKIFPFQESESLIKSVVGAVLTPFSNAFEVKLTGSLEKPEWVFVMGPTNFLRSLADGGDPAVKPAPASEPKAVIEKP